MKIELALFGNPNSGKTTLFNELTGDSCSVGNWTGTTVNLGIGHFHYKKQAFDLVDMPGIYSLLTHSPEQITGCEYLLNYHPDAIINIVDATNLKRNLYLTTQLIETGVPVVVALNMDDELQKQGITVDISQLSQLLGTPCVKISATRGWGLDKMMETVLTLVNDPSLSDSDCIIRRFNPELRSTLERIVSGIDRKSIPDHIDHHWIGLLMMKEHWQGELPEELKGQGDIWEAKIGEERYRIIDSIVAKAVKTTPLIRRKQLSKRIDAIVCNRFLAFPIFCCIMFSIFFLAFGPPGNLIYSAFDYLFNDLLAGWAANRLAAADAGPVLTGLIIDGVIRGVGSVMVFLPQLGILFLCLALLEFSGYISRAAFMTDKLLAKFGLSGMSFIPLVMGFGCSVPAIMACRSLDNKRERLMTMLIVPFMSCSARMAVYSLLASAFFPEHKFLIIFALYLLGVFVGFLTAILLRPILLRKRRTEFLMEMPPYRKPVWHCVWRSVWVRVWDFISHAGTVLLLASLVIWFLSNFNVSLQMTDSETSLLSNIGQAMVPLFQPLGFGHWQIAVALIMGFMSKEAVVSTLAVLYAGAGTLSTVLTSVISPVAAFALLVFILLYTPCVATLTAMRRESRSWGATLLMMCYQFVVAWFVSFVIYRILLLFL